MTTPLPSDAPVGLHPPAWRLPAATRCGPVRLQVADLDRSIAWYGRVLGFACHARDGAVAELGAPGGEVLAILHAHPGATPVPRAGRVGLFHVAYVLPDRPALARFARHLAALGVPAASSDHAVSEAIYLHDPDGLGIEVYRDRPRDAWRRVGRELHMVTEPLDVAALLAEADGAWDGAPSGTRVGHVHLSVRSLEQVRAFHYAALGLDVMVWRYPGALFLAAGGYHHHLGANTWSAAAPAAGEHDARLLDWSLMLPSAADVDATIASVRSYGHSVERTDEGAILTDPDGMRLRLLVDVHR